MYPNKTLTITIKGKSYTIEFPNQGKFLDIEFQRQAISRNMYGAVASTSTTYAMQTQYTVDMIATFSILLPQLKDDLGIKDYFSMSMIESKELLEVYLKKYLPWLNEWMKALDIKDDNEKLEEGLNDAQNSLSNE